MFSVLEELDVPHVEQSDIKLLGPESLCEHLTQDWNQARVVYESVIKDLSQTVTGYVSTLGAGFSIGLDELS